MTKQKMNDVLAKLFTDCLEWDDKPWELTLCEGGCWSPVEIVTFKKLCSVIRYVRKHGGLYRYRVHVPQRLGEDNENDSIVFTNAGIRQ